MTVSTPSGLLRAKLELVTPQVWAASERLWSHPNLRSVFPAYLQWIHSIIRASVPLMETARDRARELAPGDAVAAGLARYLEKHIPEERDHDKWILADLERLGVDRDTVLRALPAPTVAQAVGAQYYWIHHHHPVALLGYIAFLEGYPPTSDHLDGTVERTGLPREAFSTLYKHAVLDVHHREDFNRSLDALPLEPEHMTTITLSAFQTVALLATSLQRLVSAAPSSDRSRAV